MSVIGRYLKKHTETQVKEVGIEQACEVTGKSKATLGRYYSDHEGHADRFIPIEAVALIGASGELPACDGCAGGAFGHVVAI